MQNENNKSIISNNNTPNTEPNANIAENASNAFSKMIGRTMYTVQIYFSTTSKESFNDKLLRLIKNDIANGANGR